MDLIYLFFEANIINFCTISIGINSYCLSDLQTVIYFPVNSRNSYLRQLVLDVQKRCEHNLILNYFITCLLNDICTAQSEQVFFQAFQEDGFLLTVAVGISFQTLQNGYAFENLCLEVDFFNVMMYDLHGSWDGMTGHHTSFYDHPAMGDIAYSVVIT